MIKNKSVYSLHLPPNWWSKLPEQTPTTKLDYLDEIFQNCETQFQARSIYPVISNDPHYKKNVFHNEKITLLGDVFGLSLLGKLFRQPTQTTSTKDNWWPNLNLSLDDIYNIKPERLFNTDVCIELSEKVSIIRQQNKQPWGWINVPGCLQTACYIAGDNIMLDLQKNKKSAINILKRSMEIVKECHKFSYGLFNPLVDKRLIHIPHCYIPLASENVLNILLPFEEEIALFLKKQFNVPYSIHLCSKPSDVVQKFLINFTPFNQLEITSASSIDWHKKLLNSTTVVELLENDFFSKPLSIIEERAHLIRNKNMNVALYEMDEPVNVKAVNHFITILSCE